MRLSEINWLFINSLTYKIHEILDFDEMRREFLESVNLVVPYDRAAFYLSDRIDKIRLCSPVGVNFTEEQFNLYLNEYHHFDDFKTMTSSTKSIIYRSSDAFLPEKFESSKYYQEAYKPLNIYFSVFLGLIYKNQFLGSVSLYRSYDSGDFSDKDVYILESLKDHLALRMSKEMGFYGVWEAGSKVNDVRQMLYVKKGLTKRELEVVEHLYRGDTVAEICDDLHITSSTLKKHITNSYRKLNIESRAELYKICNNPTFR